MAPLSPPWGLGGEWKKIEVSVFSIFHDLDCFHYEVFGSFDG